MAPEDHSLASSGQSRQAIWLALAILILAISLGAAGQVLLKSGVAQLGERPSVPMVLGSIFTNIKVVGGFFCYAVSSLFYLFALSRLDLSYAYPMIALSYVIVTVLAWRFLGENIPLGRIAGLGIILAGVVVVALTYRGESTSPTPKPPVAAGQSSSTIVQ